MAILKQLIEKLERERSDRSPGYVQRFESVLAGIAALRDPDCIVALLPFFDDEEPYSELMYSIVHTVELFDDDVYICKLLPHLGQLLTRSPEWAMTLLFGVLNSPSTLAVFRRQWQTLGEDQQAMIRELLSAVKPKNSTFESQCDAILQLLK